MATGSLLTAIVYRGAHTNAPYDLFITFYTWDEKFLPDPVHIHSVWVHVIANIETSETALIAHDLQQFWADSLSTPLLSDDSSSGRKHGFVSRKPTTPYPLPTPSGTR